MRLLDTVNGQVGGHAPPAKNVNHRYAVFLD
jgi:hypothetical protein